MTPTPDTTTPDTTSPDTATSNPAAALAAFGRHYHYDISYLIDLLHEAPGAYAAFEAAQTLSRYRRDLPAEAHAIARVTAMRADDCGACAQLGLRMAVEAGVDRALLHTLLQDPGRLPEPLGDVYEHTRAVVTGAELDRERVERLRAHYGAEAFGELAVTITGCRLYPTLKRALLRQSQCEILTLDF